MISNPHRHLQSRTAADPDVGGSVGHDAGDLDPSMLADRVLYVPLADWPALGRDERKFVRTVVEMSLQGNGAVLHLLERLRATADGSAGIAPDLDSIVDRHSHQLLAIERLRDRLSDHPRPQPPHPRAIRAVGDFVDDFGSPKAAADDAPPRYRERLVQTLVFAEVATGVMSPCGFHALAEFFERNQALEECSNLVDALRRADEELAGDLAELRNDLRRRDPELHARVAAGLQTSVVHCVDLFRDVQGWFDYPSFGIVPDEFVAYGLDRFFEIGAAPPSPAAD